MSQLSTFYSPLTATSLGLGNSADVTFGTVTANSFNSTSNASIRASGAEALNIGGGLVRFNGTTSSFPAIKRSSTALQVRLADDSADAPLSSGTFTVNSLFTASPNNTVNHASIQAAGATTNVSLSLVPKGTGSLSGRVPTGTGGVGGGGNARGAGAVDWQIATDSSSAAADVASGASAVICGGVRNRCNGTEAFVGGGSGNNSSNTKSAILCGNTNASSSTFSTVINGDSSQATADCALAHGRTAIASGIRSVAIGESATASASNSLAFGANVLANRIGMQAYAAGQFAAQGDAQRIRAVLRCTTSNATATELFLDGASTRLTIPTNKIMAGIINIVGTKTDGAAVAHYVRQFCVKNVSGTSSAVYTAQTIGADNAAGTSITFNDPDTNGDALSVSVTGIASENWRWVASVDAVEITRT